MFHSRNNFFHHIFHINFQAGGVNTRVTADVRFLQEVFINKQLHMIFLIVHKSKYTDRTRCNIKEFLHISFIAEGKSGNAKLGRYFLCLKLLVAWQEQQIEVRFLAVAEKQVFADYCISLCIPPQGLFLSNIWGIL